MVDLYGVAIVPAPDGGGIATVADERFLPALQALLPPGRAWTRAPHAELTAALGALSVEVGRIHRAGLVALREADPSRASALLPEWERLSGLPTDDTRTLPARRAAVVGQLVGSGGQHGGAWALLAAALGYELDAAVAAAFSAAVCTSECVAPVCGPSWKWAQLVRVLDGPEYADGAELERAFLARWQLHRLPLFMYAPGMRWSLLGAAPGPTIGTLFSDRGHVWLAGGADKVYSTPVGEGGGTWTQRHAAGVGAVVRGFACNPSGGVYVAVGEPGLLLRSTDQGATWVAQAPAAAFAGAFYAVAWTGAAFVAVGEAGEVQTSADGATWAHRASGVLGTMRCVAADAGVVVASGAGGELVRSTDHGATWAQVNLDAGSVNCRAIVVGAGGQWLAVYDDHKHRLSADSGATWTPAVPVGPTGAQWSGAQVYRAALWAHDRFVAVGDQLVASSRNGTSWKRWTIGAAADADARLEAVALAPGLLSLPHPAGAIGGDGVWGTRLMTVDYNGGEIWISESWVEE